jgi:hypothetical protein
MAGFERITALTEELRRIAKDLEKGHFRYATVLTELHALGLPTGGLVAKRGPGRPRKVTMVAVATPRRRARKGALSAKIVGLLTSSKKEMKPREIVAVLKAKPTSVSTTLNRLSKLGRIKHSAKGWRV